MTQEWIALSICGLVASVVALKITRTLWAKPLSRLLIKRGQIRLARKVLGLKI